MSVSGVRAGDAVVLDIGCGGNQAADASFGVDIIEFELEPGSPTSGG
jgi:hypothetical protein